LSISDFVLNNVKEKEPKQVNSF